MSMPLKANMYPYASLKINKNTKKKYKTIIIKKFKTNLKKNKYLEQKKTGGSMASLPNIALEGGSATTTRPKEKQIKGLAHWGWLNNPQMANR
jgi:hypothetical protein